MNTARIRKLVTAGFIAAALLVAVPAESQALTPASARSSVVGSAAAAHSPTLQAVAPAKDKAALAMLPACDCPPNAGEVKYAMKELGVKSLSLSLLIKRLGKQVGTDVFAALAASLSKKAATVRKRIPFPDYQAQSATTYAKSPYRVYEIYGTSYRRLPSPSQA